MTPPILFPQDIPRMVAWALEEDIREGDITAGLIGADTQATATLITREDCVLAGTAWVNEVFRQVDPAVRIDWQYQDADRISGDSLLARFEGPARALLTGERTALNFLQTLSGTATACRQYADLVADTEVRLLDTRSTLPGLRSAQK